MLNEEYIIKLVTPLLNRKREISEFEFFELFSEMEEGEQIEIKNIIKKYNIFYVLEKEEETKELARIEDTQTINNKDHKKYMNLENEQLCKMYQEGDNTALAALMEKNKRFVYKYANKFYKEYKSISTVDDLCQWGYIGLIEAAKRFNNDKGNKFSTYAYHWVRQTITRAIMNDGNLVRIPVHVYEKIIKVNKCRNKYPEASIKEWIEHLKKEYNIELTQEELKDIILYADIYMKTSSLNDVLGEDGKNEKIEYITSSNVITPEEYVEQKCLRECIEELLGDLKERERKVIISRFGLEDGISKTLEEVGKEFDVTRERVRQIEAKAIKKLRNPVRSKKIKDFYKE